MSNFWSQKRVCVTGGAGFLGKVVIRKLKERGARRFLFQQSKNIIWSIQNQLIKCLQDANPDIIIHLAAHVGGIGANREHPAEFFYDNLMMGVQLIHKAWQTWNRKICCHWNSVRLSKIYTSTIQGRRSLDWLSRRNQCTLWSGEKDVAGPITGLRDQYGFNSIFLLPVNLYGPGDNFNPQSSHVIPALIRKCVEAENQGIKEIEVWGDGSPTREFIICGRCS